MNTRLLDNMKHLESLSFTGKYDMPVIKREEIELKKETVSFNNRTQKDCVALHFFIDDYQFERIWNNPERYIEMFKKYEYICSPDYSLFLDDPKAIQIYNTFKKQYLGAFYQSHGIKVVPTVSWSDPSSYKWCFDGIEQGSCVACSSVGCLRNKEAKLLFIQGFIAMNNIIKPSKILMVGKLPEELSIYEDICVFVKTFQEEIRERMIDND